MIYTDSGKHAIRAITYIASRPDEELPVSAADTAEASCPLHDTWKHFRESLLGRLADMTVADLVTELDRKRRYLGKQAKAAAAGATAPAKP